VFYEHGFGYVLCGWRPRISIKKLKAAVKESAPDTNLMRQGRSKLFYMEGPAGQVTEVGKIAFDIRLDWLRRHPDEV
jgi:hypothetical protein